VIENDRLLLLEATATGAPRMLMNSEVTVALPTVVVDQPRR